MDEITFRMIERIIGVLIGGAAIYFGFKLFLSIPEIVSQEGKVTLPGGSIHLTRTGPGIFFAFFGSFIVITSFYSTIKSENVSDENNNHTVFEGISNVSDSTKIAGMIQELNRLQTSHAIDYQEIDSINLAITLHNVKVQLIEGLVARTDLSEFKEFQTEILLDGNEKFAGMKYNWAKLYHIRHHDQ